MTDQSDIMLQSNPDLLAVQSSRARSQAERQNIYTRIKDAILSGSFGERGRLPTERDLAERFGAARNTIRKTMSELVEEGLIERHVGRGTFVVEGVVGKSGGRGEEFSLAELMEARLLFEPGLPDLVVERAGASDIAIMDAYLAELRAATTWAEFKEAKYGLHLAIARATRNRFITFVFEQIVASRRRAQWGRPGGHPNPVAAVREAAYRDNVRIVEALRAGDAAVAREAIHTYLIQTLSVTSSS